MLHTKHYDCRLAKPSPSNSDFFQKDNREEALTNKVYTVAVPVVNQ